MQKPILIKDLGYSYSNKTSKQKCRYGIFQCYCGTEFKTRISSIKNGHTKGCGCLKNLGTHGLSRHRLYTIHDNMKQRCHNKNSKAYKYYGGRGITIFKQWRDDFMSFYNWSINNGYQEHLTIDRINNDKGYNPDNCRWTTRKIQSRNSRKLFSTNTS